MTDYQKLESVLDDMKLVLNEKLCNKLLELVHKYTAQIRAEESAKVMPPAMQELEKKLKHYQRLCIDAKGGHGPGGKMELDFIIKHIKESYGS